MIVTTDYHDSPLLHHLRAREFTSAQRLHMATQLFHVLTNIGHRASHVLQHPWAQNMGGRCVITVCIIYASSLVLVGHVCDQCIYVIDALTGYNVEKGCNRCDDILVIKRIFPSVCTFMGA